MADYKLTESIHHGDYRHSHSKTVERVNHETVASLLRESPYNHGVATDELITGRLVRDLLSTGKASFGWADYTLDRGPVPVAFDSLSVMRQRVTESGSKWFSPATMRYWESRLHPSDSIGGLYCGGRVLITSEKDSHDDMPRIYRLRWFHIGTKSGQLTQWGPDTKFTSEESAKRAIRQLNTFLALHPDAASGELRDWLDECIKRGDITP